MPLWYMLQPYDKNEQTKTNDRAAHQDGWWTGTWNCMWNLYQGLCGEGMQSVWSWSALHKASQNTPTAGTTESVCSMEEMGEDRGWSRQKKKILRRRKGCTLALSGWSITVTSLCTLKDLTSTSITSKDKTASTSIPIKNKTATVIEGCMWSALSTAMNHPTCVMNVKHKSPITKRGTIAYEKQSMKVKTDKLVHKYSPTTKHYFVWFPPFRNIHQQDLPAPFL